MGRAYEVRKASIQKTGAAKAKLYSTFAKEIYLVAKPNPDIDTNINRAKYSKNGITYFGKKLDSYKNTTFIEKFVEIQTSGETIIETDDKGNIEYSLETIKGNKKLEIVYIMQ